MKETFKMNVNSKRIRVYTALMLVISAIAVALRTVACINDLVYSYGYFESKLLLNTSAYVVIGGFLVFITYIFVAERMSLTTNFASPKTYLPTGGAAICLLFIFAYLLKARDNDTSSIARYVTTLASVFAILSIIHFFLNAFISESHTEIRGYFSLATVAFLALYAAYLYFTSKLPLNAPNKLSDQLAYLFSALFFLYESRISLGREKWKSYVVFGLISALSTAYSSIPALLTYFIKGRIISNSIEESVFTFTLFLFITSRMFLTASIRSKEKSAVSAAISSFAKKREASVLESIQVHREAFSKQMTIDDLLPEDDIRYNTYAKDKEETDEESEE